MLLVERRELLERFRAGDRAALEEVYRHHAPEVVQFLSRGFGFSSRGRSFRFAGFAQPFDLENALQETFARAFKAQAREGYDGISSYKNYLLAIARNFVLDELRRREVAMSPLVEADVTEAAGDDGAPAPPGETRSAGSAEIDYLHGELRGLYARFVESLDGRDRIFFQARFEEQQTQVDAGKRAGMSHMQARTLEKKLRERFLKFMHKHGYLDGYGRGPSPTVFLLGM